MKNLLRKQVADRSTSSWSLDVGCSPQLPTSDEVSVVAYPGAKSRMLAGVLLVIACGSQPAAALTITGHYDGSSFSTTPYYTCGPSWNCADPTTHSNPVTPTADWVVNAFNAAARYWERRIADPWTVNINYGFGPSPGGTGHFNGGSSTGGRYTTGTITFNSAATWFLSPNPGRNDEYQPLIITRQTLPAGSPQSIQVTTGLTAVAIPYGPVSVPEVTCGGVPCGAYQDLMSGAIHELAHALNLYTASLSPLNVVTIRNPFPSLGQMQIPDGPLEGTLVPWTNGGGGHPFVKPFPGAMPAEAVPPEFSDPRLDSPSGDLITNGFFFYGQHRRLVSDLDAVIIAAVSDFRRVNLSEMTYVALPDFKDTATLRPDSGGHSSLMTLNGDAALVVTTDAAGNEVTALRLTPDAASQAGSGFLTEPFGISSRTAFESEFGFRVGGVNGGGPLGSDGFAFVLQADPRGASAIGNGGEGLGYGDNPTFGSTVGPIAPSLAIEFDTHLNSFDPNDNHVSIVLNGDVVAHSTQFTPEFALNDGVDRFAWVNYDPWKALLLIYLSDTDLKPASPVLSEHINLAELWGRRAYFGFTASTGGGFNFHDILAWNLRVTVPEPSGLALLGLGLAGLRLTRRRTAS